MKSSAKLLIIWPRYERGLNELFKTLLENFESTIIYVAAGTKGRHLNSGNVVNSQASIEYKYDELGIYKNDGRIQFWNYPGFRASSLNFAHTLKLFVRLYRTISQTRWDFVLFSTHSPLHSKLAYIICKIKRVRCGAKIEVWEDYIANNLLMWVNNGYNKHIIRGVDATFPHGKASLEYCKAVSPKTPSFILPFLIKDHGQHEYSDTLNKFVFCGALSVQKNVYNAVLAFLSSAKLRSCCKFIIAGDGPMYRELLELVKNEHAEDIVHFKGAYDTDDLPNILDNKSVFVLSSFFDGWSVATLEATSLNRPLILSDRVGAHYDLLKNEINGYLVSADNIDSIRSAMERIVSLSKEETIHMQEESRAIFTEYSSKEKVVTAITKALIYT